MSTTQPYFLGESQSELGRLEFQAKAWRDVTLMLCVDAGIRAGHRVVDLGCGPGFLTFDLASIVGADGQVLAVDKSREFLDVARKRMRAERIENVSILEHDIEQAVLPRTGFDFVVARWLDPYVEDLRISSRRSSTVSGLAAGSSAWARSTTRAPAWRRGVTTSTS